eukprot:GEMP01044683.1.p1 GENE.GEMP01044683.1~~GEMP01044683.1.p1  ORF type:complete len:279 (+),score=88.75 GEMP01044683.1:32-868(+)
MVLTEEEAARIIQRFVRSQLRRRRFLTTIRRSLKRKRALEERRKLAHHVASQEEELRRMRYILDTQGPREMNAYVERTETIAAAKVQLLWKAMKARRQRKELEERRRVEIAARLIQRLFLRRRKASTVGKTKNYARLAAAENVYNQQVTDADVLDFDKKILADRAKYNPSMHIFATPEELVEDGQRKYDAFVDDAWAQRRRTGRTYISVVQIRDMIGTLENAKLDNLEVGHAPRWFLPEAEKRHRALLHKKMNADDDVDREGPLEMLEEALGYKFKNY